MLKKIFTFILILAFFQVNISFAKSPASSLRLPIGTPQISERFRQVAALTEDHFKEVMGESYHDIRNFYIDERTGRYVFQKKLAKKEAYITYYFENSVPMDLSGKIEDLLELYEENAGDDENNIFIRYLVFKELAMHREKAIEKVPNILDRLKAIKENEKSQKVRDEIQVAINLISGKNIDGMRRLAAVFAAYEHRDLDIGQGGIKDVNTEFPRTFRNKRGDDAFNFIPDWQGIIDKNIEAYNMNREVVKSGKFMKKEHVPDSDFYVDGHKVEIYSLVIFNPATDEYEPIDGVPIYLLKCDRFFSNIINPTTSKIDIYRAWLDDLMPKGSNLTHPENAATAMFFSRAVLKAMERMGLKTDIINMADWQLSLACSLLKKSRHPEEYNFFKNTKTILTIHNIAYKGMFDRYAVIDKDEFHEGLLDNSKAGTGNIVTLWDFAGLSDDAFQPKDNNGLEFWSKVSLLKGGIVHSDLDATVSVKYSDELLQERFGMAFEGVLQLFRPFGLPNGIALREWYSATSPQHRFGDKPTSLDAQLGVKDIPEGKGLNKAVVVNMVKEKRKNRKVKLKEDFTIDDKARVPVFVFVGRLTDQKGINIILDLMETKNELRNFLKGGKIKFIFAGGGDNKDRNKKTYQGRIEMLERRFPNSVAYLGWLQRKDEIVELMAAGDVVLMPSGFEPSGLVQKQGARLGALIIANKVGGLAEDIVDFGTDSENGNGYVFDFSSVAHSIQDDKLTDKEREACVVMLFKKIQDAMGDFADRDKWEQQVRTALRNSEKFGWDFTDMRFEVAGNILLKNYDDVFGNHIIDHRPDHENVMQEIYDFATETYIHSILRLSNNGPQLNELQKKINDLKRLFKYIRKSYEKNGLLTNNFHSFVHCLEVTRIAVESLTSSGLEVSKNDILELIVAGMLHDFVPERGTGKEPQTKTTVGVIKESAEIKRLLRDLDIDWLEVKAIIAKTAFPFDDEAAASYTNALSEVNREHREKVDKLAAILQDSGLVSTYLIPSPERAGLRVRGLAKETDKKEENVLFDTPAFLEQFSMPAFDRLPQVMQDEYRAQFEAVIEYFRKLKQDMGIQMMLPTFETRESASLPIKELINAWT